jgi:hypothetical protein
MDPRELLMVGLIFCIWSFLYKENIFFRFAEKAFIAVTAGQTLCLGLQAVWNQNLARLTGGEYILIIPTLLGLTYLLRLSENYRWVSRFAIAIMMGTAVGMATRTQPFYVESQLLSTLLDLSQPNNIIIVVGAITSIFYFYFMRKPGTIADTVSKVGRGFLMINYGGIAAGVLLTRMTYLQERVHFILKALGIIAF